MNSPASPHTPNISPLRSSLKGSRETPLRRRSLVWDESKLAALESEKNLRKKQRRAALLWLFGVSVTLVGVILLLVFRRPAIF